MSTENNSMAVMKLFFDGRNTCLHIREVARRTGLSPYGAMKILESLHRDGLLIREKTDIVVNYTPDVSSERFLGLKRSQNLYSLYETGLLSQLNDYYGAPECIVLFGSYARGEDDQDSDIDLAIVTPRKGIPDLADLCISLKRKINVHLVENILAEDRNFANSLANGIVLSGYMEIR